MGVSPGVAGKAEVGGELAAVSSSWSAVRARRMTSSPAWASPVAIAAPMPWPEPVSHANKPSCHA